MHLNVPSPWLNKNSQKRLILSVEQSITEVIPSSEL